MPSVIHSLLPSLNIRSFPINYRDKLPVSSIRKLQPSARSKHAKVKYVQHRRRRQKNFQMRSSHHSTIRPQTGDRAANRCLDFIELVLSVALLGDERRGDGIALK